MSERKEFSIGKKIASSTYDLMNGIIKYPEHYFDTDTIKAVLERRRDNYLKELADEEVCDPEKLQEDNRVYMGFYGYSGNFRHPERKIIKQN